VFVHATALEQAGIYTLNEGQKVTFEVISDRGKTKAASLQVEK
jgi:CspA family cold shock protein